MRVSPNGQDSVGTHHEPTPICAALFHPFVQPFCTPFGCSRVEKLRKMHWQLAASYPDYFLQLGALLRDLTYLGTTVPQGAGEPTLLIPGFLCGDWTMGVMGGWLNRLGYRAYFSGIAWNIDCPKRTGERLHWRLDSITQATGYPIVVVGHGLGGHCQLVDADTNIKQRSGSRA